MNLEKQLSSLRRQQNLSQEQLAERLGVSRQAVSKWESGAATPELEKLIALCELYHLSLDQLLGLPAPAPEQQSAAFSTEALEQLLKEQQRLQQSQTRKQQRWILGGAACGILLLGLAMGIPIVSLQGQFSSLQQKVAGMETNLDTVQQNISLELGSVTGQLQDALKEQERLVADASVRVVSENLEEETVTLSLRVIPKNWSQDLSVEFEASGREFSPIVQQGNSTGASGFSAEFAVPMDEEITLSAAFIQGQSKQLQLLETLYGYGAERYQLELSGGFSGRMSPDQGVLYFNGSLRLDANRITSQANPEEEVYLAFPISAKWMTLRNGTQIDSDVFSLTPEEKGQDSLSAESEPVGEWITYQSPFSYAFFCEPEDELEILLEVEDNLGRRYQVTIDHFLVGEDGGIGETLMKF